MGFTVGGGEVGIGVGNGVGEDGVGSRAREPTRKRIVVGVVLEVILANQATAEQLADLTIRSMDGCKKQS